jgi:hypothetical protein
LLWGGKEEYESVKKDVEIMENDPILRNTHKWYDLTRDEMFDLQLKKFRRFAETHRDRYFN